MKFLLSLRTPLVGEIDINASGQLLEQRHIEQASAVDEQRFDVQRQPTGMLFLRAQSGQQTQTIKLIKQ